MAGGSLVGWRPWDGAWRVAAVMRGAVAAPPTLLPRRSTDASALPTSTQVYCNALALYEDATEQRHRGAAPAKARGRAPTVPAPSVSAASPRVGAEVGMGLSASVAMLNHRCDPNVDWGLDASGGRARASGPPSGPVHPLARPELSAAAQPQARTWWPWAARATCDPQAERRTCRGAPPLAFPSGARAPCVPHGRRPHPFVELPGCLVVRALRPIRPGEELCLSYVETSLPTAERKAHLLAHFGFECGCTRCAKE